MSTRARVCDVICSRPGITQLEIARMIYGSSAYQNLVANICRQLLREGLVARSGTGGRYDPFTFTWVYQRPANGLERATHEQQLSG